MTLKPTSDGNRTLDRDDRAVAEVVGAILMFALIVLLLVLIQINAVPAANKQIEFEHNQRVTQDFRELQEALYRVDSTGTPESVTVETGVTYPSRFFLLNPAPSTGTIRTTDSQTVEIRNAAASGNPADYWNGDPVTYTTRGLQYRPDYNELPNPGVQNWEHSLGYSGFDDGTVTVDDPTSFIDGRAIQLTLIDGLFSRSSLSESVELAPISTGSRTVGLSGVGGPIELAVRTDLSPDEWNVTLVDQPHATFGGYDPATEILTIELAAGVTYDLTVSKVRVGTSSNSGPGAHYLTDVSGNETTLAENTTRRFVVEARDRYNTPVSDVPVDAAITNETATTLVGDLVEPVGSNRTDSDGRVTFRYVAPPPGNVDADTPVRVRTSMPDGSDTDSAVGPIERARFDLTVLDSDRSGLSNDDSSGDINPYGPNTIQLEDAVIESENRGRGAGAKDVGWVNVSFKNTYASTDVDISRARLVMYAPRNQMGNGLARTPPAAALLYDDDEDVSTAYRLDRGGSFATVTAADSLDTIGRNGGVQGYRFEMVDGSGENYFPVQGEIFTLTIVYDNGDRRTYLITPRAEP